MKDGHWRADGDPDDGGDGQDLDRDADPRRLEQPPVEAEDGELGEGQGEGVDYLGDPEEHAGLAVGFLPADVDGFDRPA